MAQTTSEDGIVTRETRADCSHKATHHFDSSTGGSIQHRIPSSRWATSDSMDVKTPKNAESRDSNRVRGSDIARKTHSHSKSMKMTKNDGALLQRRKCDGYFRDQSVFGDGISIEDTMSVMVKYKNRLQWPTRSMHSSMGRVQDRIQRNGEDSIQRRRTRIPDLV